MIVLGCYALLNIGYSLFILRDCPEDYNLLLKDIERSKENLRAKGFKFEPKQ